MKGEKKGESWAKNRNGKGENQKEKGEKTLNGVEETTYQPHDGLFEWGEQHYIQLQLSSILLIATILSITTKHWFSLAFAALFISEGIFLNWIGGNDK